MRASLFAVLEPCLRDARVLDAFAGTGVMGLEALSRGARHCTFVERDREALAILAANIRTVGFAGRCDVRAHDLREKLVLPAPVDLAFLDPPFALPAEDSGRAFLRKLLADLRAHLVRPRGRVVFRYEKRREGEAREALAALSAREEDVRGYGRSVVSILTLP
jgi:16S rRNA (guanine(966)-N(2))-methyltransferase RsmD